MDYNYDNIMQESIAQNTRVAYTKAWGKFENFCQERKVEAFPAKAKHVIDFLVEQATKPVSQIGQPLSMGTIILFRSAINRQHVTKGVRSPTNKPEVCSVLKGLMRIKGTSARRVDALREHHILAMMSKCGSSKIGIRNAAILALGFSAALRRSEICNLKVEDIEFVNSYDSLSTKRMFITIRKSKTDQNGAGQKIAILEGEQIKAISRLEEWLQVSKITTGYLFQTMSRGGNLKGNAMHHSDIPRIVKYYANEIGLDASKFSGHSLRAGFVTSAAIHNARLDKIMEITRHRNPTTVMQYIRDADAFTNHAGDKFL